MLTHAYDFPVELRKLKTVDGLELPKSRAIVRTDTNEPLSVVSDKYRVITHRDFSDMTAPFIKNFGKPETKHFVERNGAVFSTEYVFRDHKIQIANNNLALRLIISNAYMPGYAARLRVASIVLECLNCAIFAEKNIFNLAIRHTGQLPEVDFPTPEKVLASFTSSANIYARFGKEKLTLEKGNEFLASEPVAKILPTSTIDAIDQRWQKGCAENPQTVWDLLQHATFVITHQTPRLTFSGRLTRLRHTARAFNLAFAGY